MTRRPGVRCDKCRFWDGHKTQENPNFAISGECRRHAPRVVPEDRDLTTTWPDTASHEWCGEWEEVIAE